MYAPFNTRMGDGVWMHDGMHGYGMRLYIMPVRCCCWVGGWVVVIFTFPDWTTFYCYLSQANELLVFFKKKGVAHATVDYDEVSESESESDESDSSDAVVW